MKRLECSTVTDALMQAMENAEQMAHVVVLYEMKPEYDDACGMYTDDKLDIKAINYLVDSFKAWLFHRIGPAE